jgi:hypothetical protein
MNLLGLETSEEILKALMVLPARDDSALYEWDEVELLLNEYEMEDGDLLYFNRERHHTTRHDIDPIMGAHVASVLPKLGA